MVVPSPCCTGCPLLHATDTRGITTDYNRGKHTDGVGWEHPLTHVAAPADVEQFYAMLRATGTCGWLEEGCYTGCTRDYVATEPSYGWTQPVQEGEPSEQNSTLESLYRTLSVLSDLLMEATIH